MARRDIVRLEDPILTDLKVKWEREQIEMKKKCVLKDIAAWQLSRAVAIESSSETEEEKSDDDDDNDSWHSCEPCGADCAENEPNMSDLRDEIKSCNAEDMKNSQEDDLVEESNDEVITYVAGTDISFVKGDDVTACASLVVVKLPKCEVVYEDTSLIEMEVPYIPGYLAFREAPFFIEKLNKLKESNPKLMPQAVLVDGNGILHVKEFGLACHIGVGVNIPSVGVAKTLFHVDGLEKNQEHQNKIKTLLQHAGDTFPLVGDSGTTYGVALRCLGSTTNPIYVSQGHNISLDTAIWLVKLCSKYRIPEPIRQADMRSREFLRKLERDKASNTGL